MTDDGATPSRASIARCCRRPFVVWVSHASTSASETAAEVGRSIAALCNDANESRAAFGARGGDLARAHASTARPPAANSPPRRRHEKQSMIVDYPVSPTL
eukprot:1400886-Prymnesium_polylepis.1